jgi:N-acetylglucosaminyl-diphospho-decaprenol L-rhamnosyltransferase
MTQPSTPLAPTAVPGQPSQLLDVSVCIVTYNSARLIERCLDAVLAAADGLDLEVIVADNTSKDGTADLVAARYPGVQLIRTGGNLGFGKANNLAFRQARGRYLLVLNPDAVVQADAIRELVQFADAHPNTGLVGGRLEYEDGRFQHSAFKFPSLQQAFFGFFDVVPIDSEINGRYPPEQFERPFRAEHILGAFILLRRAAIESVGAFDPRIFMYFEETDLCYRLRRAGWQNCYVPSARCLHVGGASTSEHAEAMSVEFHRSQAYFYRKQYGLTAYLALKMVVVAGIGYRFARSLRALVRGRIGWPLFHERTVNYFRILTF